MTLESSNDTVAILYDIENSPFEMLNFTLEKAERYQPCRIIVVSDWDARPEQKRWEKLMRRPGFTFRQISRTFFGKNSLDSALHDSAQILYREGVRKFFIVTTDTDFVHIAEALNADTPSYIIGVGTKQASESLRSAYNEFFVYPPEEDVKNKKNQGTAEPVQEKAKGKKVQEKLDKGKAAKEQPKAAKEKRVKEKAAKEKITNDKPAKEKTAKAAVTKTQESKAKADTAAKTAGKTEPGQPALSVRIPKSLRKALEERCQVEEVTLDELVTYLIMRGLR